MRGLITAAVAAVCLWAAAPAPSFAQSRSHVAAAEEMLAAMDARGVYEDSIEGMLRAQIAANPELAPYEEVMRGFFRDYVSWEAVRGDFVRAYTSRFSESELRELAAFYLTPIGRRLTEESPSLGVELGLVSQGLVEKNQAELTRRVLAAMEQ